MTKLIKTASRKATYKAPRLEPIGKVTELTSGPVTTNAEGAGLGFQS